MIRTKHLVPLAVALTLVACRSRGSSAPAELAPDGNPWTRVTVDTYARAKSDTILRGFVEDGAFGALVHERTPASLTDEDAVRQNYDTIDSIGVFDLSSPVTVSLPDPGERFQALSVISEEHSILPAVYGPGTTTLSIESVGTRYALVGVRTHADPSDPDDLAEAAALQDQIVVQQEDPGTFEAPHWNPRTLEAQTAAMRFLASTLDDTSGGLGEKGSVDPIHHWLSASYSWGGTPKNLAVYAGGVVQKNDGKTAHVLTIPADVPVDGFWSITAYDRSGRLLRAKDGPLVLCSSNVERNADGSATIRFGGDAGAANHLPIAKGWSYIVRLYRPRPEILDGSWTLPKPARLGG
ncbi:MAG: DUF1214 domain-containing protein [Planctomycetota bacterium]